MQQLQKYKKIGLGHIPENWSFKKIGELLDENNILEIQDGNHGELHPKLADFTEKGIPFLTANCITNNRISFKNCKYLPELWLKKLRIGFARENDVIITHKGTLGLCAIVPIGVKNLILSPQTTYYRLSPRIHSLFLFYFFQSSFFQDQLFQMGRQSTRDYIGITSQRSLTIILPTIHEQQKIASIISKVDELIQKTDQIIEQTQRLKKGLIQRLLAKGIGHTKFNEVLKERVILDDLIEIKHGYAFKGQFFTDSPTENILLTPGNFSIGGGFKDDKIVYYEGPVSKDFILSPEDLIVTMTDLSKMGDTLGYPAVVPSNPKFRYLHNQRLGKIIIKDHNRLYELFLYYLLSSNEYRQEILASATGSTVRHTSPGRIKSFKFYLPPFKDQQKIASILLQVDRLMQKQLSKRYDIVNLKKGLMQKLLTGKIRVKI
jgi:type I restriction enzyme S subunit